MKLKRMILVASSLLATCFLHAQKHDYNWFARHSNLTPGTGIHVQYVDSIQDINIQFFDWHGRVGFSPAFSSAEGEFLYFSNNFIFMTPLEVLSRMEIV